MQYHGILAQFESGARCFMIDVHKDGNDIVVMHNKDLRKLAGVGTSSNEYYSDFSFERLLHSVRMLLLAHPKAVITLILENKGVIHNEIDAVLRQSELGPFLLNHDPNLPGMTFGQLRTANTRLIVLAEEYTKTTNSIFSSDYYKETTFNLADDKLCIARPGRAVFSNSNVNLFVLNHFYKFSCTPQDTQIYWKYPCKDVNSYQEINNRVQLCANQGLKPTYVALDFIHVGENGGALKVICDSIKTGFYSANISLHVKTTTSTTIGWHISDVFIRCTAVMGISVAACFSKFVESILQCASSWTGAYHVMHEKDIQSVVNNAFWCRITFNWILPLGILLNIMLLSPIEIAVGVVGVSSVYWHKIRRLLA